MHSWQDTLRAALRPGAEPAEVSEYELVLREVTDVVNQSDPALRVEVRSKFVGNLQRLNVLTSPRRYPVERSIMLSISVAVSGDVMVPTPAGLASLPNSSPEQFRGYLVEFFSSNNFKATAAHYRRRNAEPIQGWLKRLDYRRVDLSDVGILVAPEQQDRLVAAYEAGNFADRVELTADIFTPVGNFRPYDRATAYSMMDSAGFVLKDVRHEPVGGDRVAVSGVPFSGVDWRAEE